MSLYQTLTGLNLMGDTKIEWADKTWNVVTGCTKVSAGCKNCYAEKLWPRLNAPGQPYEGRPFTDVKCHPERLGQPISWRKPAKIFVNSMSDLFHEDVPDQFIIDVFNVIRECYIAEHSHIFQILTKRPERMADFCRRLRFNGIENDGHGRMWLCDDPADRSAYSIMGLNGCTGLTNVWMGVSVEDQQTADERIPWLLQTPAPVRFLSIEPMLGPVDLKAIKWPGKHRVDVLLRGAWNLPGWFSGFTNHSDMNGIDWVIVGGESGSRARPMHPFWVRKIQEQCEFAEVPFLFKQWGSYKPIRNYYEKNDNDIEAKPELPPFKIVNPFGYIWNITHDGKPTPGCWIMRKGDKKASGRLLDGKIYDEYPIIDLREFRYA